MTKAKRINQQDLEAKSGLSENDSPLFSGGKESLLQAAMDNLPAALALLDEDGEIILSNKLWRETGPDMNLGLETVWNCKNGQSPAGYFEKSVHGCKTCSGEKRIFELLKREDSVQFEYPVPDSGKWFLLSATPVELKAGETGMLITHVDITARRQAELTVENMARIMDINEEIALLGGYKYSPETNDLRWTNGLLKIHGLDQDFIPDVKAALSFLAPNSAAKLKKALAYAYEEKSRFDLELDLTTAQGKSKKVRATGEYHDCPDEQAIVGTYQDITRQKSNQLQKEELIEQLKKRVKEFYCLYQANGALQNSSTVKELLGKIIALIPQSWSHPQHTCARAVFGGRQYTTEAFKEYDHSQSAEVMVEGNKAGKIEVFVSKDALVDQEAPFLSQEQVLLESLAQIAGQGISSLRTRALLEQNSDRFNHVIASSKAVLLELNLKGEILYANDYVEKIFEYTPQELVGQSIFKTIVPEYDSHGLRLQPVLEKLLLAPGAQDITNENENITKSGQRVWITWHNHPVRDENGVVVGQYSFGLDMTGRKKIEDKLRRTKDNLEQRVQERTKELNRTNKELQNVIQAHNMSMVELEIVEEVLMHSLEGITITDNRAVIQKVNPAFTTITGYPPEEAIGKRTSLLKSNRHGKDFYSKMWSSLREKGVWSGEIWNRRKNGEAYPEWLSIGAVRNENDEVTHYVAVFHDLSEFKEKEEQLSYQLYFDGLTGLPNRRLFQDRVRMAINIAERNETRLALIHIDIDNFKSINDSLGVLAGDELILQVAERLKERCRENDNLARFGGDDYVLLMEDAGATRNVVHLVENLLGIFDHPFKVKSRLFYLTASAGVAFYPNDGIGWDHLIKNAELAMYRAKQDGRNRFRLFTSTLHHQAMRRLNLEDKFRKALKHNEFEVWFQPKILAATQKATGMEALVRWRTPDDEIISPAEFIPLAEETGLIIQLGQQVLEMSLSNYAQLNLSQPVKMAVNLSPLEFTQPDLAARILGSLEKFDVRPENLEIEITESILLDNYEDAITKLEELSKAGVSIAIDDFGTGYSSLVYLKKLPIDTLKIDREFICNLDTDKSDADIVKAIMTLAHNFGLTVVSEGVETEEQFTILKNMGSDEIQGYFFGKPMPFKAFSDFMQKNIS